MRLPEMGEGKMFNYRQTMDALLEREVNEGRVAGASALVLHRGREIYFHTCGYADRERQTPMRRDTLIRLFSMTKPITAAAVMILAERGVIDVWDAVSRYLPAFQGQQVWTGKGLVPAERENTIWDLLNMTSGICYPNENDEPGRQMGRMLEEMIAKRERGERADTLDYANAIARVPLCFQPGTMWMYGYSADVLGAVVEAASGMRFGEFLRKEIFEPLEMKDTGFFVPECKRDRFAQAYEWGKDQTLEPCDGSHLGEYYGEDVAFESGGAGLVSTIDDYSRFARMMVQKGQYEGKQILGQKTVEFMTRNHLSEKQRVTCDWDSVRGYGYSCLMRVLIDQGAAGTNAPLGEYGWDGWTGNYVTMDPEDEMVLLYFIQRCGAGMTPAVRKLRMATYAVLPFDEPEGQ